MFGLLNCHAYFQNNATINDIETKLTTANYGRKLVTNTLNIVIIFHIYSNSVASRRK